MTQEEYSLYRRRLPECAFYIVCLLDPAGKMPELMDRTVCTKCRSFAGLFEAYSYNKREYIRRHKPNAVGVHEATLDEFVSALKAGLILWCCDSLLILRYV